jgi:3,8-divinyl chlorophyllide a/chlorophyllide a reductase subunit X
VLAAIPQDDDLRKKSANYQIVGSYERSGARCSPRWPRPWPIAPPVRPKPLTQDGLLGLFDAETTGGTSS